MLLQQLNFTIIKNKTYNKFNNAYRVITISRYLFHFSSRLVLATARLRAFLLSLLCATEHSLVVHKIVHN